jgi:peptide/nickel transport system ATP-binding protein
VTAAPLLEVDGVSRDYRLPRTSLLRRPPLFRAVHDVSLTIAHGRTLGLIGESGCGKSTLARTVLALEAPSTGTVRLDGEDLFAASGRRLRALRRRMQMVFQDPYGSLDPRQTVGGIVAEPLDVLADGGGRAERRRRVAGVLEAVGLRAEDSGKYPHEFSGGQRQRIAIARALITEPVLIVADEPVSALDVSVQAQVLNLMLDLRERRGLAYLLISHDLSVVRHVTDEVAVMYRGRIVEHGPTQAVLSAPAHPYTAALMAAMPKPDPSRRRRSKSVSIETTPVAAAGGCAYAFRCPRAEARCRAARPGMEPVAPDRQAACFHPLAGRPD